MDFTVVWTAAPLIAKGIGMTVLLMACVGTLAPLLALPLALAREFGPAWAGRAVSAFTWAMRAVPTLVLLFFAYFGLPALGIYLSPTLSALGALIVSAMGYNVEFLTSGLRAVPAAQIETCRALGMGQGKMIRRIVLPQALPVAVPPLFSNLTLNLKGTSLAGLVAVPELTSIISGLISETYRPIELLLVAGAIYLCLNSVLIWLQARVEERLDVRWRAARAERRAAA
ncbi:amino acid ABC transporter permease [Frigidibacter sp. MR17.14]|uniref:amino acid ABC transporter permease n=1 Tax=Frigidibacter sp. MR17.14 TaxID=3126509 RepID=UPI0030131867